MSGQKLHFLTECSLQTAEKQVHGSNVWGLCRDGNACVAVSCVEHACGGMRARAVHNLFRHHGSGHR